jgi:alkylhydroperoxidase/carboxymuconolactone decarboxylase family protein YurZ
MAMQELRTIVTDATLKAMRASYSHDAMLAANLAAIGRVAPQLSSWNRSIAATFYGPTSPLAPRERERCLIAIITNIGPGVCLAMHVYWGLMEGIDIDEMIHVVGLAGCYGGLPRATFGMEVIHHVLNALSRLNNESGYGPTSAVGAIVQAYVGDRS